MHRLTKLFMACCLQWVSVQAQEVEHALPWPSFYGRSSFRLGSRASVFMRVGGESAKLWASESPKPKHWLQWNGGLYGWLAPLGNLKELGGMLTFRRPQNGPSFVRLGGLWMVQWLPRCFYIGGCEWGEASLLEQQSFRWEALRWGKGALTCLVQEHGWGGAWGFAVEGTWNERAQCSLGVGGCRAFAFEVRCVRPLHPMAESSQSWACQAWAMDDKPLAGSQIRVQTEPEAPKEEALRSAEAPTSFQAASASDYEAEALEQKEKRPEGVFEIEDCETSKEEFSSLESEPKGVVQEPFPDVQSLSLASSGDLEAKADELMSFRSFASLETSASYDRAAAVLTEGEESLDELDEEESGDEEELGGRTGRAMVLSNSSVQQKVRAINIEVERQARTKRRDDKLRRRLLKSSQRKRIPL